MNSHAKLKGIEGMVEIVSVRLRNRPQILRLGPLLRYLIGHNPL